MPNAVDGLARAHQCLADAIDLRPAGRERGLTLKALVETIVYEGYARGVKTNPQEIATLADRALEALDPEADEQAIRRMSMLRNLVERS